MEVQPGVRNGSPCGGDQALDHLGRGVQEDGAKPGYTSVLSRSKRMVIKLIDDCNIRKEKKLSKDNETMIIHIWLINETTFRNNIDSRSAEEINP